MPLGKRGLKRSPSSSSSTTSTTVTTIAFIALCVLGVWMLTGKTFSPPKINTTTSDSGFSFSDEPETLKATEKNEHTVFEDNPGVLPIDAIQTGDPNQTHYTITNDKGSGGSDKQDEGNASSAGDDDSKMSDEQKVKKIIEEQKKQNEVDTQMSEDKTLIENQQFFVFDNNAKSSTEEMIKQQLRENAGNQTLNANDPENHISDEDKRRSIEKHQEQHVQQKEETPFHSFSDQIVPYLQPPPQQEVQVSDSPKSENVTQETEQENTEETDGKRAKEHKLTNSNSGVSETWNPDGGNTGSSPKESLESRKSWSTQASQSQNEKERRKDESEGDEGNGNIDGYTWRLCNETTGPDFIPCLDNTKAIQQLRTTAHYEHRERHCPEEGPVCLVPLPEGYKVPIPWPKSRDKVRDKVRV